MNMDEFVEALKASDATKDAQPPDKTTKRRVRQTSETYKVKTNSLPKCAEGEAAETTLQKWAEGEAAAGASTETLDRSAAGR